MKRVWPVREASARLSEILRRARAGEPQVIGLRKPCVVLSAETAPKTEPGIHLGRFLIESAPRGPALDLPPRSLRRGDPFEF